MAFYTDKETTDAGLKRMTIVATMEDRSEPLTVYAEKKFCALFGVGHDGKWALLQVAVGGLRTCNLYLLSLG